MQYISKRRHFNSSPLVLAARSSSLLLAAFVISCGGASQGADSPNEASLSTTPEPSSPPAVEEPPMDESEQEDYTPEEITQPITAADLQASLQIALDDDAMRTALNLEEPGRFPLKIYGPDIPSDIELSMIGQPVEVVSKPEDPKKEPVLVFTRVKVQANSASFKFRYDIAGIRGSSSVTRTEGRWELKSSRFSEYLSK